jgi:hypothetical protein
MIKLKRAERIGTELTKRQLLLISGKRDKAYVINELFQYISEYMDTFAIAKPILRRWLVDLWNMSL